MQPVSSGAGIQAQASLAAQRSDVTDLISSQLYLPPGTASEKAV